MVSSQTGDHLNASELKKAIEFDGDKNLSDSEMRMLFDLEMLSETDMPPASVDERNVYNITSDILLYTEDAFVDKAISPGSKDTREDVSLKTFNASLDAFSLDVDDRSSPESIFSENYSDSMSPKLSLDGTLYPSSSANARSVTSLKAPELSNNVENESQGMQSADPIPEYFITSFSANQSFQPRVLDCIDPLLTEMEDVDTKFASLERFNQNFTFTPPEDNFTVYGPELNAKTLELNSPEVSRLNIGNFIGHSPTQSEAIHYNGSVKTANSIKMIFQNYGNVVQQVAGAQCTCENCKSIPFSMGQPIAGTLGKKRYATSRFRLLKCTPKDFKNSKKPKAVEVRRVFPTRPVSTDIDFEPGVVGIIKQGDKRMPIRKRLGLKSGNESSNYSFKPPSQYMMKAWNTPDQSSQFDGTPEIQMGFESQTPLPCQVELSYMDPVKRWQEFKHRYAQIDQSLIQSTKECRHCCRLFADIESYMIHLQRHKVYHQFFCLDKECPLAVIGFPRKYYLRRHLCNDHLEQYTPFLSTHKEEILSHDLTKQMYDSVYMCDQDGCYLPFYRLDARGRHVKYGHKAKTIKKRRLKLKPPSLMDDPRAQN